MAIRTFQNRADGQTLYGTERDINDLLRNAEDPLYGVDPVNHYLKPHFELRTTRYVDMGGLETQADLIALLRDGWADGATKAQALAQEIGTPAQAKARRRVRCWADNGAELNIDRALRGEWERAYRGSRREMRAGSTVIDLVVAWGGNASMTADHLFWGGATMLVLTDVLESAGYRVRLIAADPVRHYEKDNTFMWSSVVVKEASDPLSVEALAAVTCHAGVYRTLGFAAVGSTPVDIHTGIGYTETIKKLRPMLEAAGEWSEGSIVVEHAYNRETAVAEIAKAVGALGA